MKLVKIRQGQKKSISDHFNQLVSNYLTGTFVLLKLPCHFLSFFQFVLQQSLNCLAYEFKPQIQYLTPHYSGLDSLSLFLS